MKASAGNAVLRDITLKLMGKPNKKVDQYYMLLGRFVTNFSFVEQHVQSLLWRLAKLESPISQAILSGVRTEAAISLIYRIADAERWSKEKKEAYKDALDQLQVINKLRNDLLHRGSRLQPNGTWLITNEHFVHIPERTINVTLTVSLLRKYLYYSPCGIPNWPDHFGD
jgi:hypothetical protein